MKSARFACSLAFLVTVAACGSDPSDGSSEPSPAAAADMHTEDEASATPPNDDPALGGEADMDTGDVAQDEFADPPSIDANQITTTEALTRVGSPVPNHRVTYPYGVRSSRYAAGFHTGQDYAASIGTRVVAVRGGVIRWSNNNGGAYGKWIGLDADNGRTYVYCHLSSRLVASGTRVHAGQLIGRVGATGNVTGPHLHFEDHPRGPFRYAQVRRPSW